LREPAKQGLFKNFKAFKIIKGFKVIDRKFFFDPPAGCRIKYELSGFMPPASGGLYDGIKGFDNGIHPNGITRHFI